MLNPLRALLLGLALAAAPLAAQPTPAPSAGPAGTYHASQPETASALILGADGRFRWLFSMGAVDMVGEGRWSPQPDGSVQLDSDPPVTAPTFALVSSRANARPDLTVRVAAAGDDERQILGLFGVAAEYGDGTVVTERLENGIARFTRGVGRPIVAVRLLFPMFAVDTRHPLVGGGNDLVFRFVPNDLGRADFRAQRLAVEPDTLRLSWRSIDLLYYREGRRDAIVAAELARHRGLVDVRLGEPVDAMRARSTFDFTQSGGGFAVDLRLRFGEHVLEAGRIGGGELLPWRVDTGARNLTVDGVEFAFQDRYLAIGEAIRRGRDLHAWFGRAGFVPVERWALPDPEDPQPPFVPFSTRDSEREPVTAADWDAAALLLGPDPGYENMDLFLLRNGEYFATAELANIRRTSTDPDGHQYWPTEGDREWILRVKIFRDPAITMARDFPGSAR